MIFLFLSFFSTVILPTSLKEDTYVRRKKEEGEKKRRGGGGGKGKYQAHIHGRKERGRGRLDEDERLLSPLLPPPPFSSSLLTHRYWHQEKEEEEEEEEGAGISLFLPPPLLSLACMCVLTCLLTYLLRDEVRGSES